MKKNFRILARRLAKDLNDGGLSAVSGRGTSYYGTGGMDDQGRRTDWRDGDSTDGWDRYYPYA